METEKETAEKQHNHNDFLDGMAAIALITLSVLLVIFILDDQPY